MIGALQKPPPGDRIVRHSQFEASTDGVSSIMRTPEDTMNIKLFFSSLLALALLELGKANWIRSRETEVSGTEGRTVNLLCNYGLTSTGFVDLYWFRQYPNQALEFILFRGWGYSGKGDAHFAKERFYSKTTANSTDLFIKSVVSADTALYYCALRKARREVHIGQPYKNSSAGRKLARLTTVILSGAGHHVVRGYWVKRILYVKALSL